MADALKPMRGGKPADRDGEARYGAIEAGGTKFVCAVGNATSGSLEQVILPTRDVSSTLDAVLSFFRDAQTRHGAILALGMGSFGPLDLDPDSATFGFITRTPKSGWENTDLLGTLSRALAVPAAIDTDVNAAALAEAQFLENPGSARLAYVTVGTGIGVGLHVQGRTVRGAGHPELGHVFLRRHPSHGTFGGVCPYHGDCLEGLASGPAIEAAWRAPLSGLADDHVAWTMEADYLGQLCALLILTLAPTRIVLGGGVMSQQRLFEMIRVRTARWLGGYLPAYAHGEALARCILMPQCREASGLTGAFLLAEQRRRSTMSD